MKFFKKDGYIEHMYWGKKDNKAYMMCCGCLKIKECTILQPERLNPENTRFAAKCSVCDSLNTANK